MRVIDTAGALVILQSIARVMEENRDRLVAMDSVIGDGDLGLTMSGGFGGAAQDAEGFVSEPEPGKFLMKAGMAINKYAPSTMGTLMATGFMRGGKATAGKAELTSADLAVFFQAFLDGIMERGKAKPGEKTVVDAVLPAAEAAKAAAVKSLAKAAKDILAGAKNGVENSKTLMSQHGKAAVFREKTIGLEDPGCVAFSLVAEGFANALAE
jgi:dihydroxyacetone kinase-like protein